MFRRLAEPQFLPQSFPRVSGDVPAGVDAHNALMEFSPRERGCSGHWPLELD